MSDKKREPLFKDTKSAVITITVIVALLGFAVLAIDRNNVNRLTKLHQGALRTQRLAYSIIDERFEGAQTLGQILLEEGFEDVLGPIVAGWGDAATVQQTSQIYLELERVLALVQRSLYQEDSYLRMAPYFEAMYAAERALIEPVQRYNDQVAQYNAQISAFPAILTARRIELVDLAALDLAAALKGRP